MSIKQIVIQCNGPITDVGPIGDCTHTFAANTYAFPLARKHAAYAGWVFDDHDAVDLCPEHAKAGD